LALGADGASIGTRFIVSKECDVKEDYKTSILGAGMDDIVLTTKISGTPCNVVNTEAAKKMGYEQNFFEKWMSNNPRTKKWFKMLVQARGMKKFEESLLPNRYLQLWSAGKSSALIHREFSVQEIVNHYIEPRGIVGYSFKPGSGNQILLQNLGSKLGPIQCKFNKECIFLDRRCWFLIFRTSNQENHQNE
nr:nitronate monooxygenase [Algoriphagus sp.]